MKHKCLQTISKKSLIALLIIATIITSVIATSIPVYAENKHDYEFRMLLKGKNDPDNTLWISRVNEGLEDKAVPIRQVKMNDAAQWVYCLNQGKGWGTTSSEWTTSYNFEIVNLPNDDPRAQVQKTVMRLGFADNNTQQLKTMYGYNLTDYEAYQATQAVMWAAEEWVNNGKKGTLKNTLLNTMNLKVPDYQTSTVPYDFACTLADAVQSVDSNGVSSTIDITKSAEDNNGVTYKITIATTNYYGGYSAELSNVPSNAVLTSNNTNVTISNASHFSSKTINNTDTLYLKIPSTNTAQSFKIELTVTPNVRKYASDKDIGYMSGDALGNDWQNLLYRTDSLLFESVKNTIQVDIIPKTGFLTIKKASSNSALTNNNACYTLKGAVYTIYTDAACKKAVDTLTIKADGTSNTLELNAGTYYVKETTAPNGYALDTKVYTVTITSDHTKNNPAVVTSKEPPVSDPDLITVKKQIQN